MNLFTKVLIWRIRRKQIYKNTFLLWIIWNLYEEHAVSFPKLYLKHKDANNKLENTFLLWIKVHFKTNYGYCVIIDIKSIIIEQDSKTKYFLSIFRYVERTMRKWKRWVRPILSYNNYHLSGWCCIFVTCRKQVT